jgi:transcriptional regulator GlxA family with amidase domain
VKAGADDVLVRGVDDERATLSRILADARGSRTTFDVLQAVAPLLNAEGASILAYCLEHANRALTVEMMARDLGVHRKTLVNRLAAAHLPVPSVLVAWCRLLLAARLMEDESRATEQIAFALDFGSGAALRNMLRRYTGLRPNEIRANGGLSCVVAHFLNALMNAQQLSAL